MAEFMTFGNPERFEIAFRWCKDSEPRDRRPLAHGWSMGDLRITVAGQVLTQNKRGQRTHRYISWYLSPFFSWLASNWLHLLHEERPGWNEDSAAPAAAVCRQTLYRFITAEDENGRKIYGAAQDWYFRHGIRTAAEGGLFPDLFIRRLSDDIEVSWLSNTPEFAGEDFAFSIEPGCATFPVEDVAKPLWRALCSAVEHPPEDEMNEKDRELWAKMRRKVQELGNVSHTDMEEAFLGPKIRELLEKFGNSLPANLLSSERLENIPALHFFSPAVAMLGGVNPNLSKKDVNKLLAVLQEQSGGEDADNLRSFVENHEDPPFDVPHISGHNLAEDLLDVAAGSIGDFVDVRGIVEGFGIAVDEVTLDTDRIRGVAVAGEGFSPKILVNLSSVYNNNESGLRFTIAHELCHILYDRSRARRVTHVSSPWVSPIFEKRANAFAAYLLMPSSLVVSAIGGRNAGDPKVVKDVAERLKVGASALVEHLRNLKIITGWDREELRRIIRPDS